MHADGDTAKSAARRYNNDPAPIAGGLNCPGSHVVHPVALPDETEPAPHEAHPDWSGSTNCPGRQE